MASHLKNVHATLHKADSDYDGHRVKAMHQVTVAIGQLGGSTVLTTGYEYGGGNLPQAESDRLIDEAMFHLRRVEGSLGTGANLREHHGHARTSVAEALREARDRAADSLKFWIGVIGRAFAAAYAFRKFSETIFHFAPVSLQAFGDG